jgi:hypothetical protein
MAMWIKSEAVKERDTAGVVKKRRGVSSGAGCVFAFPGAPVERWRRAGFRGSGMGPALGGAGLSRDGAGVRLGGGSGGGGKLSFAATRR